jgi:uncharacterized lipoprotein NlpE involved in copper resistance
MKKIILSAITMAFILVSCNQKNKQVEETPIIEKEIIADSIITNDTVLKEKTAPIIKKDSTVVINKETANPLKKVVKKIVEKQFSCPMHPEVKGKKGAECPKCGMELTEPVD